MDHIFDGETDSAVLVEIVRALGRADFDQMLGKYGMELSKKKRKKLDKCVCPHAGSLLVAVLLLPLLLLFLSLLPLRLAVSAALLPTLGPQL